MAVVTPCASCMRNAYLIVHRRPPMPCHQVFLFGPVPTRTGTPAPVATFIATRTYVRPASIEQQFIVLLVLRAECILRRQRTFQETRMSQPPRNLQSMNGLKSLPFIVAHRRGHPIKKFPDGHWRWGSSGQFLRLGSSPTDPPCVLCATRPTPEGYDPCLGFIPAARSACCGHGVEPGHITLMTDGWMRWFRLPILTEIPYASSVSRDVERDARLIPLHHDDLSDTWAVSRKATLDTLSTNVT